MVPVGSLSKGLQPKGHGVWETSLKRQNPKKGHCPESAVLAILVPVRIENTNTILRGPAKGRG